MIIGCGANFKAATSTRTEAVEIEKPHSPSRSYGLCQKEFEQNWTCVKKLHGDTPGTLAHLHMQQPLRWPYAEYLLGAQSGDSA